MGETAYNNCCLSFFTSQSFMGEWQRKSHCCSEFGKDKTLCLAFTNHCTSPQTHHPHCDTWWWHQVESKINVVKYRKLLDGNLFQFARELQKHFSRKLITWSVQQRLHRNGADLKPIENNGWTLSQIEQFHKEFSKIALCKMNY